MEYRPQTSNNKSFTLIEVLVGVFSILIIFLGIFGAYQLGLKVVNLSKNRIIATAIANAEIEKIRNMPYQLIGIQGGFPNGSLESQGESIQNNIRFEISRKVDYVVDSADGIASPDDDCPNDYKKIEIKISWTGVATGEVKLSTDVAPKNLAQECSEAGGILSVSVFDAYGIMVNSPLIEVKNPLTDEIIKTAMPSNGKYYFSLSPSTYKVVISKDNYSTERTYGIDEVVTPEKPHSIILEDQLTELSFSMDRLSGFSVDTFSSWKLEFFSDSFPDASKISELSNLTVNNDIVSFVSPNIQGTGYLISNAVLPENLIKWEEFSFSDFEPEGTKITYRFLYLDGENWVLIPDSDLAGNAQGFSESPVNLSVLNKGKYPQLKVRGNFSTTDLNLTPTLFDWQISWREPGTTPAPNISFHLQGSKIIGSDGSENPVYKYSQNHVSNSSGHKNISNLEWDSYIFSIDSQSGLDLIGTDPASQPIGLSPNANLPIKLYLDSENTLLVTVQNNETLAPIFSANVRLYNSGLGYDVTQNTNEKGQTYFIPLEPSVYNLEVQAPGCMPISTQISVSGDITKIIKLEQIE